jgi:hypothetical protein
VHNKLSSNKKIAVVMEWMKRHPVLVDGLPKNNFKLRVHFVKSRREMTTGSCESMHFLHCLS